MSILLDDQRWINLKFHYLEIEKNNIIKYKFIKNKEEYEFNKNNPNLKELNTGWKILTWADYNNINSECTQYVKDKNGIITTDVDLLKLKYLKLKTCLKSWDLKDNYGNEINLTAKTIDLLHPDVARELLEAFEKITDVGVEELKNLGLSAEAFFEGKQTASPPPKIVYEFFIAKIIQGWSLEYIRNLTLADFYKIIKLCACWENITKKWEAEMATAGMGKKSTF